VARPRCRPYLEGTGLTRACRHCASYHYNWSTKGLTTGEYRMYANLADGTKRYVDICLTK
jgi:hypothetical protein